jgi:trimeric autotransporter adhesin
MTRWLAATARTTCSGGTGSDLLVGGDGNDLFYSGFSDVLLGEDGNDTVIGGAGADYLDGGTGLRDLLWYFGLLAVQVALDFSLTFTGDAAGDYIANFEDVWGSSAGDTLAGDGTANILTGDDADDLLLGQAGADTLIGGNGGDTLDGGTGGDSMVGGTGNDRYVMDDAVNDRTIELVGEGRDTVASYVSFGLGANVEDVELLGTSDIYAYGNELDNFLLGNAGNNYLDGLDGADTLSGGLGNDYLIGGEGNDLFLGEAGEDYMGGQGGAADTVTYVASAGPVTVNLFLGTASGGDAQGDTLSSIEQVIGSNFDDQMISGTAATTLIGGLGNDTLNGGGGPATLHGGEGNDAYLYVDQANDVVAELPGEGADTVHSFSSWTLSADVEDLVLIGAGALSGIGNALANRIQANDDSAFLQGLGGDDTLTGGALHDYLDGGLGNDSLVGGGGNDFLDGSSGNDTMAGGTGNDFYLLSATGGIVVEDPGGGYDTVQVGGYDYALGANLEELILTGGFRGTGNALDNRIIGSSGVDTELGLDGNDELFSNGGADSLDGGNGNDTLHAGSGAQTLAGGQGNDLYDAVGAGDVLVEAGTGADTVIATVDWTLAAPFEVLMLTGTALNGTGNGGDNAIIGNALDNLLNGGSGNDTLDGGLGNDTLLGALGADSLVGGEGADSLNGTAGADTMAGGNGDDAYVVDDAGDVLIDTGGIDTVFTVLGFTLTTGFENLTLTANGLVNGTGNGSANIINGNGAANLLAGGNGNDSLFGDGGADTLSGGAGADTMAGGAGSDRYVLDGLTDVVIEHPGEGSDIVVVAASWTLGADFERLQLTGSGGFSGTGNALSNRLAGNDGANLLSGGLGNDTLVGGSGADTLVGEDGRDLLSGMTGADWFLFATPADGLDRIADFTAGTDKIAIVASAFGGGLVAGSLAAANFISQSSNGAVAPFGTPQFVYNDVFGVLFYDVDGAGGAAGIRLVNLTGVPALSETDFILV